MDKLPESARAFFAEHGRRGGQLLAGTDTARERAKTAAAARWAKYYAEHPEKLEEKLAKEARKNR